MRYALAILALLSMPAYAIPVTFFGTWDTKHQEGRDSYGEVVMGQWLGEFDLGEPVAGGYRVRSMYARVGNCPSPQGEDESHIDWFTHVEDADCSMHGPKANFDFGFNPLSGLFFALSDWGARLGSSGHSDLYLGEDGTFSHVIYTHRGAVGTYGTYEIGAPAQAQAFAVPEPGTLALYSLMALAFSFTRTPSRMIFSRMVSLFS